MRRAKTHTPFVFEKYSKENCYLCVNIYDKTERLSNKAVENYLQLLREAVYQIRANSCYLPKPANEILSPAVNDNIETEAEQSLADITLQHLEDNDDEAVNLTSQDVAEYLGKENYDITESPLVNVVSDFHQV